MNTIDCSIVIPHFENSQDLARLLKSIPNNDRFETIVVDDYSSDECFRDLLALKSMHRFELLKNTGKKSAGTCRNIGLRKARGKCVLFADSDDFFLEAFESQLYKHLNSPFDIIFFPPTSIYNDTGLPAKRHLAHEKKATAFWNSPTPKNEYALRLSWNCPWSKLYKSMFLKQNSIEFDEVIAANDLMFSLKSGIAAKHISVSLQPIYCCTAKRGSLENTYSRKILEARITAAVQHARVCQKLAYSEFGGDSIGVFYQIRFLKLRDQLYLIKLCQRLGVFKNFSFSVFFKRALNYFYRTYVKRSEEKKLLVIKS